MILSCPRAKLRLIVLSLALSCLPAKALGLTVPPGLLVAADEVIE
jgi:hypothetical protein